MQALELEPEVNNPGSFVDFVKEGEGRGLEPQEAVHSYTIVLSAFQKRVLRERPELILPPGLYQEPKTC